MSPRMFAFFNVFFFFSFQDFGYESKEKSNRIRHPLKVCVFVVIRIELSRFR